MPPEVQARNPSEQIKVHHVLESACVIDAVSSQIEGAIQPVGPVRAE